jgi:hypothetical protein
LVPRPSGMSGDKAGEGLIQRNHPWAHGVELLIELGKLCDPKAWLVVERGVTHAMQEISIRRVSQQRINRWIGEAELTPTLDQYEERSEPVVKAREADVRLVWRKSAPWLRHGRGRAGAVGCP